MKGGTISGCESRNYGGAIYLDGGSFEMNGGIIEIIRRHFQVPDMVEERFM